MIRYQIEESFDIDNDSLSGKNAEQCFALGVEWEMFRARIMAGEVFTDIYHSANADRLARLAERHGRFVEYHDYSEGWTELFVGANRS